MFNKDRIQALMAEDNSVEALLRKNKPPREELNENLGYHKATKLLKEADSDKD